MLYKILVLIAVFIIIFLSFHKSLASADVVPEGSKLSVATSTAEFKRIGSCESTGNPNGKWDYHAKNPNSSASGVFQWINGSWYHYGKELWGEEFYSKNIWSEDNVILARYVYDKYGTRDWNSSKSCWASR